MGRYSSSNFALAHNDEDKRMMALRIYLSFFLLLLLLFFLQLPVIFLQLIDIDIDKAYSKIHT